MRTQCSLTEMLATNSFQGGLSLVVLKSYFDGGNQADSSQYDVLSLAAVSGTQDIWEPFEEDWNKMLKDHGAAYLHTTDAIAKKRIYEGWEDEDVDKFLIDCVKVAGAHSARPNIGDMAGRYGLFYFVVSFVLKDFVAFTERDVEVPSNVNEVCLRQALAQILPWSFEQAACEHCHFFFDQGETFYGHLCQLLQRKKARIDATALNRIVHKTESDMRCVPALQLADLYAWGQSHRKSVFKSWHEELLRTWFLWEWIDQTNLHMVDRIEQATWSSWKLPKRKATK